MDQKAAIMRTSIGIDYAQYATGPLSFDYERLFADTGYDLDAIRTIQRHTAVGSTPLVELVNLTELVRALANPGHGAGHLVLRLAQQEGMMVREAGEALMGGNYGGALPV
jgi:hypothetical protein